MSRDSQVLSLEERAYVRDCVDVIVAVYKLFGLSVQDYCLRGTYTQWIMCAGVMGDTMKWVKYKLNAFYAVQRSSATNSLDLPTCPILSTLDNPGVLLGGRAYAFQRALKKADPLRFEEFLVTLQQSKKGMPRPGKEQLRKAEISAYKSLTTRVPDPAVVTELVRWSDIETDVQELHLSQDIVCEQLVRTVREFFTRGKKGSKERIPIVMTNDDLLTPFFPSTSANYINSRGKGGAIGTILEHPELLKDLRTKEKLVKLHTHQHEGRRGGVSVLVDDSALIGRFTELYCRMRSAALKELPVAVPLALAEALKTRVITKGPPLLMTVLKPYQKFMWETLVKHPACQLIGEPVTQEYIESRMGANLQEGQKFLSVDYTDATNEMYSWVSDSIMNAICDTMKFDADTRKMLLLALTGHIIEDRVTKEQKPQVRGQLMGSITSFPILCIANVAICRFALEQATGRRMLIKDAPLGVNGDDAVMKTTAKGQKLWGTIGAYCGLKPSVGKVYFSDEFLNLNSTTFVYHKESFAQGAIVVKNVGREDIIRHLHYRKVEYVNLGLLYGMKRSGGDFTLTGGDDYGSIGARARTLCADAPEFLREKLLTIFIAKNNKALKEMKIPWFIPEHLGGLGLPTFGKYQPEDLWLRLARKIYENPERFQIPHKQPAVAWTVWKKACSRFPRLPTGVQAMALEYQTISQGETRLTSLNGVRGMQCVAELFHADSLADIHVDEVTANTNYYRAVHNAWKGALLDKVIPLPEPFNPERFPTQHNLNDSNIIHVVPRFDDDMDSLFIIGRSRERGFYDPYEY